jgi:hypothetical protein
MTVNDERVPIKVKHGNVAARLGYAHHLWECADGLRNVHQLRSVRYASNVLSANLSWVAPPALEGHWKDRACGAPSRLRNHRFTHVDAGDGARRCDALCDVDRIRPGAAPPECVALVEEE